MSIEKDWTIMIYMAGDNNLSADMAYALADIREVMSGKGDKINLMVYYDGAAIDAPTFYCDFTDFQNPVFCPAYYVKRAFHVKRNKNEAPEFDENSAAATSLKNFVNWCVNDTTLEFKDKNNQIVTQTYKGKRAKKYALIFSGHASAFQNLSLMMDESSHYFMSIPRLRWALEDIADKDQTLLQQPIDILGFDSCQMGMAELAYEFRKAAKILVASEGNLPSAGWTYGTILSELVLPDSSNTVTDEKEVARGFVEKYIVKQSEFLIGGVSVDISALDLSEEKIGAVIKNLNELGRALNEHLHDMKSGNADNVKYALLLAHQECQSYMFEQNVDLKDFCELLLRYLGNFSGLAGLEETCRNLINAIDGCVLMCGFSGGAYQYSNGLSAFFPWTNSAYKTSKKCYTKLQAAFEDDDPESVDKSPLKDWKIFIRDFVYNTMRPPRAAVANEPKAEEMAGYEFYFPVKTSGVANDPNIYIGGFGGNGSDTNDKNTGIGNDKNTGIGNDKNTGIGNDKNTGIGNDKNTGIGNDKNTGVGNDKNTGVGNDKNLGTEINKNTGIGNDKNTGIGNDKNTGIGNDKGLQLFLLMQTKNIKMRWNSAGFTKSPVIPKPEETPSATRNMQPHDNTELPDARKSGEPESNPE